jgi:hypothetical protein
MSILEKGRFYNNKKESESDEFKNCYHCGIMLVEGIPYFGLASRPEDEPFYINVCESCMYSSYGKTKDNN